MTTFDEADCLKTNPFEGDFGSPGDKVLKDKIDGQEGLLKALVNNMKLLAASRGS